MSIKYFTFKPTQVPEHIATLIQPVLSKDNIWNQKLTQSGKYRGLKVGIANSSEMRRLKYVLRQAVVYAEKQKVLKTEHKDTIDRETVRETVPTHTPDDELNNLFPIE